VRGLTVACEVIGGFTYGIDIFLYIWNVCLVRFGLVTCMYARTPVHACV